MKRSASKFYQTDDKTFSKIEGTFSDLHPGYPLENISNFEKYILRLSEAYRGPRNLGKVLSLTNLWRVLLPRTLGRTL